PPSHIAPRPPAEFPDSPPPLAPESPCFATNARAHAPAGSLSAARPLPTASPSLQTGRCDPNRWFLLLIELLQLISPQDSRSPSAPSTAITLAARRRRTRTDRCPKTSAA